MSEYPTAHPYRRHETVEPTPLAALSYAGREVAMSEYPSTHPYRRDETRALTLDLSELGPRAAALLELCRHTRGRLTVLDHDHPIARLVPLDDPAEGDDRLTWDIESVGP